MKKTLEGANPFPEEPQENLIGSKRKGKTPRFGKRSKVNFDFCKIRAKFKELRKAKREYKIQKLEFRESLYEFYSKNQIPFECQCFNFKGESMKFEDIGFSLRKSRNYLRKMGYDVPKHKKEELNKEKKTQMEEEKSHGFLRDEREIENERLPEETIEMEIRKDKNDGIFDSKLVLNREKKPPNLLGVQGISGVLNENILEVSFNKGITREERKMDGVEVNQEQISKMGDQEGISLTNENPVEHTNIEKDGVQNYREENVMALSSQEQKGIESRRNSPNERKSKEPSTSRLNDNFEGQNMAEIEREETSSVEEIKDIILVSGKNRSPGLKLTGSSQNSQKQDHQSTQAMSKNTESSKNSQKPEEAFLKEARNLEITDLGFDLEGSPSDNRKRNKEIHERIERIKERQKAIMQLTSMKEDANMGLCRRKVPLPVEKKQSALNNQTPMEEEKNKWGEMTSRVPVSACIRNNRSSTVDRVSLSRVTQNTLGAQNSQKAKRVAEIIKKIEVLPKKPRKREKKGAKKSVFLKFVSNKKIDNMIQSKITQMLIKNEADENPAKLSEEELQVETSFQLPKRKRGHQKINDGPETTISLGKKRTPDSDAKNLENSVYKEPTKRNQKKKPGPRSRSKTPSKIDRKSPGKPSKGLEDLDDSVIFLESFYARKPTSKEPKFVQTKEGKQTLESVQISNKIPVNNPKEPKENLFQNPFFAPNPTPRVATEPMNPMANAKEKHPSNFYQFPKPAAPYPLGRESYNFDRERANLGNFYSEKGRNYGEISPEFPMSREEKSGKGKFELDWLKKFNVF